MVAPIRGEVRLAPPWVHLAGIQAMEEFKEKALHVLFIVLVILSAMTWSWTCGEYYGNEHPVETK
jgi:hypothetical protein